jgi:hypothetical protein
MIGIYGRKNELNQLLFFFFYKNYYYYKYTRFLIMFNMLVTSNVIKKGNNN